jgi:hypothetical protein
MKYQIFNFFLKKKKKKKKTRNSSVQPGGHPLLPSPRPPFSTTCVAARWMLNIDIAALRIRVASETGGLRVFIYNKNKFRESQKHTHKLD